jgi:hypothetical protein
MFCAWSFALLGFLFFCWYLPLLMLVTEHNPLGRDNGDMKPEYDEGRKRGKSSMREGASRFQKAQTCA